MGSQQQIGYLGLGSNIGDRHANLQAAIYALTSKSLVVTAASPIYQTEPVGEVLEQRDFFNACLKIETELNPEDLLTVCKEAEQELGRDMGMVKHGPRVIDIDLLLLSNLTYQSERLQLPHPEATSRRFVLIPLLELEPELVLPDGSKASERLSTLDPNVNVELTQYQLSIPQPVK